MFSTKKAELKEKMVLSAENMNTDLKRTIMSSWNSFTKKIQQGQICYLQTPATTNQNINLLEGHLQISVGSSRKVGGFPGQ